MQDVEFELDGHNIKAVCNDGLYIDGEYVTPYDLLASAMGIDDKHQSYEVINSINTFYEGKLGLTFYKLRHAVMIYNAWRFQKNEFHYQDLFKEKCSSLGLGKIVKHKNNGKDIPDAWVNRNGELIPVEVKVSDFNAKALKQLNRYISSYKAKHGIAVARNLTVKLPDNIEFIPFDKLEREENQ